VQLAWLEALVELHGSTRSGVMRESLRYLVARETVRLERTERYRAVQLAARAARWDPISDYINGRPSPPP
jgi:Arc/MetJ-type ribon-helix-helix transcriptional regulator